MDVHWMCAFLTVIWSNLHVTGSCDPNFKASIDHCIQHVKGFLEFKPEELRVISNFEHAEVVCRQQLVKVSSACVASQYSLCPRLAVHRTQCGLQTLEPSIMGNHSDIVCKNLDAFQKNVNCSQQRKCAMKTCLAKFDQHMPSRLSAGMWKTPKYLGECRFYSYLLHCFDKSVVGHCDDGLVTTMKELLFLYRPASCPVEEVAALQDSFNHIGNTANNFGSSLECTARHFGVICLLLFRTTMFF